MAKLYCCFCGTEIEDGYGCNPDPASTYEDDRCCPACDKRIVANARLYLFSLIKGAENGIDDKAKKKLAKIRKRRAQRNADKTIECMMMMDLEDKGLTLVSREVPTGKTRGEWDVTKKVYGVVDGEGHYMTDFNLSMKEAMKWVKNNSDKIPESDSSETPADESSEKNLRNYAFEKQRIEDRKLILEASMMEPKAELKLLDGKRKHPLSPEFVGRQQAAVNECYKVFLYQMWR